MRRNPSMNSPRIAIYTRISRDRVGAGLGVERQLEDCRDLAKHLNGSVVATFTDNDMSAYSGKPRPGYLALLQSMKSGQVDCVIAWHADRLHRSMVELEEYVTASESHAVATHTVKAGLIDLSTPSGRLVARQLGAVARYEVEHAIERQRAAKLQAAKSGKPSGGNRAYGWNYGGMTIKEDEAEIVKEMVNRFIAGDSWRTIALDLNARGIPSAKGNMWTSINVANCAQLPRHYGIRSHNGNEYKAVWEPLLSLETRDALTLAVKKSRELHGARSYARRHMLTGFVYCGVCGTRTNAISIFRKNGPNVPGYACRKKDHAGQPLGCGGVKRLKAPVEDLVTDAILYRLDTPEVGTLLSGQQDDHSELSSIMREHESLTARIDEFLNLYSLGELSFNEYKNVRSTAQARLADLNKQIAAHSTKRTLMNIPVGESVRKLWESGDIHWKRQVVDALIEKVIIHKVPVNNPKKRYKDKWWFDPNYVEIIWNV